MPAGFITKLKQLLEHQVVHVSVSVVFIFLCLFVERVWNRIPPMPVQTANLQFRDTFNRTPVIHVLVDGEEAPVGVDGSVGVVAGSHRIKAFYFADLKPAILGAPGCASGEILMPDLTGTESLVITVRKESP